MPARRAVPLLPLSPREQLRAGRLPRRLVQLAVGLWLFGVSMGMMVRGGIGLPPWDVLHQGITRHTPLSFGQATILTGIVVLLLWVPIRQLPGLGTVANVLVIGVASDVTLAHLDSPDPLWARVALLVGGVLLNALASALYIGSQLGPGPRDGLMTGYARRTGRSIRLVRTGIEVIVLAVGWLLGGTVGVGTVIFALSIGPLIHVMLPIATIDLRTSPRPGSSAGPPPPSGGDGPSAS